MKLSARRIAWLLPLLLTSCAHKVPQQQTQPQVLSPPIEDAPPQKPDNAPANLPAPIVIIPPTPSPTVTNTPPPPPPSPKHKKSNNKTTQAAAPAPPPATQQASNAAPEESAAGHLSSEDAPDQHKQTGDAIADIEHGVNGITRKLSDQEQKTSAQIREFLKQARTALASGDVDGAHTLTIKAKVLLDELNQ